ncbi:protein-export chaperone SecB [Pelagibacteraceae bacterium]|nr:protein-export chaperone SecB [Pelagibacteraceae bacterium]
MNYKIVAKYIKNIEFLIPNPKVFFLLAENISNYKINIDIKSNQVKENIIIVEISLSLKPTKDDFEKIDSKIIYAVLIEVDSKKINGEELEKIILIDVPSEVYSEIRESFVFLFEKSGFKKIKIEQKVDFKKLYIQRKSQ